MYCYIYAGLLDCAADGTLCGESHETIAVCGEPLMTPHSFFLGDCLRWLPPATVSGGSPQWSLPDLILDPGPLDFGPGSTWFWTRVHLIMIMIMIMPSLVQLVKVDHPYHANFQCKLDRFHLFVRIHKWLPTVSQVTPHRGWLSATLSRPSSVMF